MSNFSTRQLVPGTRAVSTGALHLPQVQFLGQCIKENMGLLFYHALRLIRVLQIQRFVATVLSLSTGIIFLKAYIIISIVYQ